MVKYSHPEMIYLFIPLAIIIIIKIIKSRKKQKIINNIASLQIRRFLFSKINFFRLRLRSNLLILGVIFIIVASLGPQIGVKLKELSRKGVDILILLDVSKSMNAIDVQPSRIKKAKLEINKLINSLQGDRLGIIGFAGSAHLHCPLTIDYAAAKLFLNSMNTDIIESQGTDLAAALELALDHTESQDEKYKVIIIISDGEEHQGEALDYANIAKEQGIIVHTMGIGTLSGGPIPIFDNQGNGGEFKKDNSGKIVTTTLNEVILNEISHITGGTYVRVGNQINAIKPILDKIGKMDKKEIKSHVFSQYENRYQLFLISGLFLFLFEFFIPTRNKNEIYWKSRFE
tara:strand:- start:477 stop:1508 length:1032 start_codon:yes stop_codon:yes gene_type:complete